MGTQPPFPERDFKVPNCLLVIKQLYGMGCGVWQGVCRGKVSDRQWCPCSQGNGPGATGTLHFGEIWVDFDVFSVARAPGALFAAGGEAEGQAGG